MKAVIRRTYGPPKTLGVEEIEKPIPKDNEVLIKVQATTVNRTDCAVVTGKPFIMRLFLGLSKPRQIIPGTDFAGQIIAVGKNVADFKIDDRVFGFGDDGIQSQAQFMTYNIKKAIAHMPSKLSYEHAVASLEGAHYAFNTVNKVNITAGQKVMVNGATGAIGSATVQMLIYYGVAVTATCNTKNIDLIKSLGVNRIIDYTKDDFTKDSEKYDFVFDTVGKSTFGKCKRLLKKQGVYISSELGPWSQNFFLALLTPIIGGKKVKFPLPTDIPKSITFIKKMIKEEKFHPILDKTYPIEEVSAAYEYVLTGEKTGNVILKMS